MKKAILTLVAAFLLPHVALADTAAELDAKVDEAIATFQQEVNGADVFLRQASGRGIERDPCAVMKRRRADARPAALVVDRFVRSGGWPALDAGSIDGIGE